MVSLSILTQLFQSVILSMSAMDLDFIDPEVEAHMDEEEITIRGARGVGKDLIISIHPKMYVTLLAAILA